MDAAIAFDAVRRDLSLPTLIFCGVLLFRSAVIERRQIERDTVDVVRSLAADIDSDLIATTTILRALATSPALSRGDIPMFERQMRAAVEPGFSNYCLRTKTGNSLSIRVWQSATHCPSSIL